MVSAKKTEIELNIMMKRMKTGKEKAEGGTYKSLKSKETLDLSRTGRWTSLLAKVRQIKARWQE